MFGSPIDGSCSPEETKRFVMEGQNINLVAGQETKAIFFVLQEKDHLFNTHLNQTYSIQTSGASHDPWI